MEPAPEIMRELAEFLKSRGHECIQIIGIANHKFRWCEKEECPDAQRYGQMRKKQQEQEAFVKLLKQRGHVCVYTMECYPMRVGWCEKEPCAEKK